MDFDERVFQVALNMLPGIGPVTAKRLVASCGCASAVFREKKNNLLQIPYVVPAVVKALRDQSILFRAEKEISFCKKNGIEILFYADAKFPNRLKQCYDSPVVLYFEGNTDLSHTRTVGIVGTRNVTEYGKMLTEKLVDDLKANEVIVISGLAYGVDVLAHKAALKNEIPTIGVLAHGLDELYPAAHKNVARKMTKCGGLLTDFPTGTKPDKENFPMRNRIVAGLCDAIVVVESGASGGSMITAEFANNYNRDVFAFPGRVNDEFSAGCHKLIKNHKASLIDSAADLVKFMGWDDETKNQNPKSKIQTSLPLDLSQEEMKIVELMRDKGNVYIDEICVASELGMGKVSALLLQMEFSGVIKSLPGKFYRLN
ncbi:MAG: DNA-protecting protein DprA [Bacteroidetes bacterium]|nr:DNA-protecting protein DprA [Bacteroidota bacterium]